MNKHVGTVKQGRKFDQVIEGARQIFLRDGFDGASVDDIARAAGVSKATLYSYFPDKRLLFIEMATRECQRQAGQQFATADLSPPPEVVLPIAAARLQEFMLSDFGRSIYRVCVAEAERFPELGQRFYDSGPMMVRKGLRCYFERAIARGELVIDDLDLAADQFAELCKASILPHSLFAKGAGPDAEERARIAQSAVDMFLARYGTRAPHF